MEAYLLSLRIGVFLLASLAAGVLPVPVAIADEGAQCKRALSRDGKLVDGADPRLVATACLAAAEHESDPVSHFMAGLIYEQGIGQPKDSDKAKLWYRRAALKGQPEAQLAMGRLAEANQTLDWALAWYAAAARNGHAAAGAEWLRLKTAAPAETWRAAIDSFSIEDSLGDVGNIAGSGSGIVLSDSIVLTNEHVIEYCDKVAVAPGFPAKVVAKDAARDLAVLKVATPVGKVATLATEAPIGAEDALITGGFPGTDLDDPTFAMTEGQRSKRDLGDAGDEYWLLTNQIGSGNSGGPLLDASGLVRGVVFASLPVTGIVKKSAPKGGKEGMAIHLDTVKGFLDQHRVSYRKAATGPVQPGDAAAMKSHAAAITALVVCLQD
jgi:S1-C subfamily serine protease